MEHVSHKMEHLIQRQKQLLEQSQANAKSRSAKDKTPYAMAVGGVAAGLTFALIIWLAKSIITEQIDTSATDRAVAGYTGAIGELSGKIARLSGNIGSLTASVSDLESRITRLMELTESIANMETRYSSSHQTSADSTSSTALPMPAESIRSFVPTHIVKTRVNLRPAASLNTTPIAVLDVGTEVEYLSKSDGWYYVNTRSHGQGWCSSEYLDTLQDKSSAK